jgi:hypothetical protein
VSCDFKWDGQIPLTRWHCSKNERGWICGFKGAVCWVARWIRSGVEEERRGSIPHHGQQCIVGSQLPACWHPDPPPLELGMELVTCFFLLFICAYSDLFWMSSVRWGWWAFSLGLHCFSEASCLAGAVHMVGAEWKWPLGNSQGGANYSGGGILPAVHEHGAGLSPGERWDDMANGDNQKQEAGEPVRLGSDTAPRKPWDSMGL